MWIIFAIIIPIGLIIIYFISRPIPQKSVETTLISPSPTPIPVTLATWTDEAGFSFQYPDGIAINKHPDDNENYANLTLTDTDQEGSIDIVMSDKNNTMDKWANPIDTILGEKDGKKNITATKTIIGVIDNDVIVTLTRSAKLSQLLETTWQNITDSWVFIYPTPKAVKTVQTNTNTDSGNVLEEE